MSDPASVIYNSPKFSLSYIFAAQAQKEIHINRSLLLIDALLYGSVKGVARRVPAERMHGDCWLIGDEPEGVWATKSSQIAVYSGSSAAGEDESGWLYIQPRNGMRIFDEESEVNLYYHNGWRSPKAAADVNWEGLSDADLRIALKNLTATLKDMNILPTH